MSELVPDLQDKETIEAEEKNKEQLEAIEEQKKNKNNVKKFFYSIGYNFLIAIIYFYLGAVTIFFVQTYSKSKMMGTNSKLVPYSPFTTLADVPSGKEGWFSNLFRGGKGSNSFENFIQKIFVMNKWSFPYKNFFTKNRYDPDFKEGYIFRIISWFADSTADSYSNGRSLLQHLFSSLNSIVDGSDSEDKSSQETLLFYIGSFLMIFIIILGVPFYSFGSSCIFSLKHIFNLLPTFFGFNFYTFLYCICIIPIILNFLFILFCFNANMSQITTIQPFLFFAFVLLPLLNREKRNKIQNEMYKRRQGAGFLILLLTIWSAYKYLDPIIASSIGFAGFIMVLLIYFGFLA